MISEKWGGGRTDIEGVSRSITLVFGELELY
jgi:hypothetical protein